MISFKNIFAGSYAFKSPSFIKPEHFDVDMEFFLKKVKLVIDGGKNQ
jgi:hypothetical protein